MKIVFLYFFVLGNLVAPAQELIFSEEIEFKKLQNIEGIASGNFLVLKSETDDATVFYAINKSTNYLEQYKALQKGIFLVGVTSTIDELMIYFVSETERLSCLNFSKTSRKFTRLKEAENGSLNNRICIINENNNLYSLSFSKREEKLIVHSYDKEILKDTIKFDIKDERFLKLFKQGGLLTSDAKPFTFINNGVEIPFDQAKNQNKIYFKDKKVFMIIDDWEGEELAEILILELDLTTRKAASRFVNLPYENKTDHNSFLINDKLFVLGINKIMVNLTIFDFESLTKIKEYRYLKGEPIQLKYSNLEEDGFDVEKEWIKAWKESDVAKLILRSLNDGVPVMSVTARNSDYRLLIGCSEVSKGGPSRMMMTSGGGSFSTPGGNISTPSTTQWVSTGARTTESQTFFYGYLRKPDLGIFKEYDPASHGIFYKMRNRIGDLDNSMKLGGDGVVNSKEGSYLIYVDKQNRSLYIEKYID